MRSQATFAIAIAALLATASFATAKEWKTVRIGTEGAYAPFNFKDADGNLKGFEIDLGKALCEKMKVECTFVAQDWDGIIPALVAGKYDVIMASMSITDERKQAIDFSRPYYNTPSAFVAPKDAGLADNSAASLSGKSLGAQSSTIQASYLEQNYKDADIGQVIEAVSQVTGNNGTLSGGTWIANTGGTISLNGVSGLTVTPFGSPLTSTRMSYHLPVSTVNSLLPSSDF